MSWTTVSLCWAFGIEVVSWPEAKGIAVEFAEKCKKSIHDTVPDHRDLILDAVVNKNPDAAGIMDPACVVTSATKSED